MVPKGESQKNCSVCSTGHVGPPSAERLCCRLRRSHLTCNHRNRVSPQNSCASCHWQGALLHLRSTTSSLISQVSSVPVSNASMPCHSWGKSSISRAKHDPSCPVLVLQISIVYLQSSFPWTVGYGAQRSLPDPHDWKCTEFRWISAGKHYAKFSRLRK